MAVTRRKKSRSKRPPKKSQRQQVSPAKRPAGIPAGTLVPQEHGGAIRHGAQPGTNAGGTGRPPSQIRAALAESFDKRRHIYETIADDDDLPPSERIRALDAMGRLGLTDKQIEFADIRQHPDALRFVAAYHQALELLPTVDRERVTARVDELLQVLT